MDQTQTNLNTSLFSRKICTREADVLTPREGSHQTLHFHSERSRSLQGCGQVWTLPLLRGMLRVQLREGEPWSAGTVLNAPGGEEALEAREIYDGFNKDGVVTHVRVLGLHLGDWAEERAATGNVHLGDGSLEGR